MSQGTRSLTSSVFFWVQGAPFDCRSGSKVCPVSIILQSALRSLSATLPRARACLCPRLRSAWQFARLTLSRWMAVMAQWQAAFLSRAFATSRLWTTMACPDLFLLVRDPCWPQSNVRDDEERLCRLAHGVVKPQSTDAMHRPVVDLRQGRRRERNIMVEIQKVLGVHTRSSGSPETSRRVVRTACGCAGSP